MVGLLSFWISLNQQFDLVILINHSPREGWESWPGSKTCVYISRISSLQRWRLGGIYNPPWKTSRFIAVAIPDTSGMTYTAPTIIELQWRCEASELPMNVETFDRRNSRLTSKLSTLSTFENYGNWVKVCEVSKLLTHAGTSDHRNSRLTSELSTLGTFENYSNWV